MTKKFSCGDVVEGCGWSTTASDEAELFKNISDHAKNEHGMTNIPDEVIEKVKSNIQEV
jgi:predicted small metal-binding protein